MRKVGEIDYQVSLTGGNGGKEIQEKIHRETAGWPTDGVQDKHPKIWHLIILNILS